MRTLWLVLKNHKNGDFYMIYEDWKVIS